MAHITIDGKTVLIHGTPEEVVKAVKLAIKEEKARENMLAYLRLQMEVT